MLNEKLQLQDKKHFKEFKKKEQQNQRKKFKK